MASKRGVEGGKADYWDVCGFEVQRKGGGGKTKKKGEILVNRGPNQQERRRATDG